MINANIVAEALSQLLNSDEFKSSPTLCKILKYVVSEEIEGRGSGIKEYTVGIDALGKPISFDPRRDPIVRVSIFRLRKALRSHYSNRGASDAIKIEIAKGTYRPVISKCRTQKNLSESAVTRFGGLSNVTRCGAASNGGTAIISLMVEAGQYPCSTSNYASGTASLVRGLREVLSRNSAFSVILPSYKRAGSHAGKLVSTDANLRADFAISLIVRRDGEQSHRASAELIDRRNDTLVWARSFQLAQNIDKEILTSLAGSIGRELQIQIFGASVRALECYEAMSLSARELYVLATWVPGPARSSLSWEKERLELARLATEKDPNFGPAYSVVADKLAYLSAVDGSSNFEDSAEEAARFAAHALELAPNDAMSVFNVAQSQWHSGKLNESVRTMQRVIELDPNNALARFYAIVYPYTCTSAPDDVLNAAINFENSLGADNPIRWVTLSWLGWLHLGREEFTLALQAEQRAAQIFQIPYTVMHHAAVLNQLGREDDAVDLLLSQRDHWPNINPVHFSEKTIPRLCKEIKNAERMIGFYRELTKSTSNLL